MDAIKFTYKKKLLEVVEREVTRQEGRIMSAEVKLRQAQEEQKKLLNELCDLESNMAVEEFRPSNEEFLSKLITIKDIGGEDKGK